MVNVVRIHVYCSCLVIVDSVMKTRNDNIIVFTSLTLNLRHWIVKDSEQFHPHYISVLQCSSYQFYYSNNNDPEFHSMSSHRRAEGTTMNTLRLQFVVRCITRGRLNRHLCYFENNNVTWWTWWCEFITQLSTRNSMSRHNMHLKSVLYVYRISRIHQLNLVLS